MTRRRRNPFKRKFNKLMQKKLVLLFVVIVLAFVFLIGKITYINASSGEKYTKIVLDQQQYDSRTIPFKRGDVVDRNGTKLATSERVYNVILDMKVMLSDEAYIEPTIAVLKECFEIEERPWGSLGGAGGPRAGEGPWGRAEPRPHQCGYRCASSCQTSGGSACRRTGRGRAACPSG